VLPLYQNLQMKIIGLCGKKRSGKSSAAEHLQHIIGDHCYRFSFADQIKSEVGKIFGKYREDRKETLRPVYQSVGEAAKQLFGTTVWVDKLADKLSRLEDPNAVVVIDDVRFPIESEWVRSMGGVVWRIRRPATDCIEDSHVSETSVDLITPDEIVFNDSTPLNFYDRITKLYNCH